ncbi:MAG: hypothetical protein ACI965_000954 [Paraglaciecola sp.]
MANAVKIAQCSFVSFMRVSLLVIIIDCISFHF